VDLRQHRVEHDQVWRLLLHEPERRHAAVRFDHAIPGARKHARQHTTDLGFVVDDQDRLRARRRRGQRRFAFERGRRATDHARFIVEVRVFDVLAARQPTDLVVDHDTGSLERP
jgi:hypothetical protein